MGGFPLKRYFIYTWALSLLQLKKHFKQVHLITDDWGKRLLIDILQLPYETCSTQLNELESVPSKFWCVGKLYTFSNIKEPFMHFDGDLILGDYFNNCIIYQPLIAEFKYIDTDNSYISAMDELINNLSIFTNLPISFKNDLSNLTIYEDYNMGIFGGNNYCFINDYAHNSINLIQKNLDFKPTELISISFINCLIEQFCFYQTTKIQKIEVELCIKEPIESNKDYQNISLNNINMEFDFVHLHNHYKLNYYKKPEAWLQRFYPAEYKRINAILFN
jgi:hypothetical protein